MKCALTIVVLSFTLASTAFAGFKKVEFECHSNNGSKLIGQIEEFTGIHKHFEGDFDASINLDGETWYYPRGKKVGSGNQALWVFYELDINRIRGEMRAAQKSINLNYPFKFRGNCVFTRYEY